jgi:acylphosphatase
MKAYRVCIEGQVQGVGFRYYTQQKAESLGISGWIRNCSDGSVETLICGPEPGLKSMLKWLEHGPNLALVSKTHIQSSDDEHAPTGFKITN